MYVVFRDLWDIPSDLSWVLKMNQLLSPLNQPQQSLGGIRPFVKVQDVKHCKSFLCRFFSVYFGHFPFCSEWWKVNEISAQDRDACVWGTFRKFRNLRIQSLPPSATAGRGPKTWCATMQSVCSLFLQFSVLTFDHMVIVMLIFLIHGHFCQWP